MREKRWQKIKAFFPSFFDLVPPDSTGNFDYVGLLSPLSHLAFSLFSFSLFLSHFPPRHEDGD